MSEKSYPVGGVDYPRTMQEFDEWFSNEVACVEYLRRLRWPEGFQGPNCGKNKAWLTGRGVASMRKLSAAGFGDCGYTFRRHPKTASHMVSSDVVYNESEVRR